MDLADFIQKINWIDLLVVILLVRSSYVGFTKGLGWELFRFIGYIGAVLVCVYYYEYLSQLISDYLPAVYSFSNLLSFTAIYIIILFIFNLLNLIVEKIVKLEITSAVEKTGGLVFGFARGAILLSFLLITFVLTPIPYFEKSVKERSYMGQTVLGIVPFIYDKAAGMFPALKFGGRNDSISKITGYNGAFQPPDLEKFKSGFRK